MTMRDNTREVWATESHLRHGGLGLTCLTALYWVVWQSQTTVVGPLMNYPQSVMLRESALFVVFAGLWWIATGWMINPNESRMA